MPSLPVPLSPSRPPIHLSSRRPITILLSSHLPHTTSLSATATPAAIPHRKSIIAVLFRRIIHLSAVHVRCSAAHLRCSAVHVRCSAAHVQALPCPMRSVHSSQYLLTLSALYPSAPLPSPLCLSQSPQQPPLVQTIQPSLRSAHRPAIRTAYIEALAPVSACCGLESMYVSAG